MHYTLEEAEIKSSPADKKYINFWKNTKEGELPPPLTIDVDRLLVSELENTTYSIYVGNRTIYVDNALLGVTINNYMCFIKSAFLSNYYKNTNHKYSDYSKYLWVWDKHEKYVNNAQDTYMRLDFAKIQICAQGINDKKNKVVRIRHQGSVEGGNKKYSYFTKIANSYLVRLQQGPNYSDALLDIFDGTSIKNYSIVSGEESRYFDMHHIRVRAGQSIDKTEDPTSLFGRVEFTDLEHHLIYEILKCILIPAGLHKEIHGRFKESSGIQEWMNLLHNKKIAMLPYYLLSEHNYDETLRWLSGVCPKFILSDCPSYADFMLSIT